MEFPAQNSLVTPVAHRVRPHLPGPGAGSWHGRTPRHTWAPRQRLPAGRPSPPCLEKPGPPPVQHPLSCEPLLSALCISFQKGSPPAPQDLCCRCQRVRASSFRATYRVSLSGSHPGTEVTLWPAAVTGSRALSLRGPHVGAGAFRRGDVVTADHRAWVRGDFSRRLSLSQTHPGPRSWNSPTEAKEPGHR